MSGIGVRGVRRRLLRALAGDRKALAWARANCDAVDAQIRAAVRAQGGTHRTSNPAYPFLSLDVTELAARAAADRKVSEVARGPGGFLSAYRRADGHADSLHGMAHASGQPWTDRRAGFIARHMAQAGSLWERDPSDPKGGERPTRRHLALAVWAYSPDAGRLRRWLRGRYV